MCLSICRSKGFPYTGLEWQIECHCGHEPVEGFEWAWPGKCDDRCSGNSNQICGGSNAMSVWTTPINYLEGLCINDFPQNRRVLDEFSVTGLTNLTVAYCGSICQGKNSHWLSNLSKISSYYKKLSKFWAKAMNILVYRMVTVVIVVMMIPNSYQLRATNAINLVLGIKMKSVVLHGDFLFMDRDETNYQLLFDCVIFMMYQWKTTCIYQSLWKLKKIYFRFNIYQ